MEAAASGVVVNWSAIGGSWWLTARSISMCGARYVATDEMRFLSSVTLSVNDIERRCSSLNSRWLRH
jgi:hypothetical protein